MDWVSSLCVCVCVCMYVSFSFAVSGQSSLEKKKAVEGEPKLFEKQGV